MLQNPVDSPKCLTLIHIDSYSHAMAHTTSRPRHNGLAIRDFRIHVAKMTVDELANRLAISAPHLRNIENEHREPTPLLLAKIADIIGIRAGSMVRDTSALTGAEPVAIEQVSA